MNLALLIAQEVLASDRAATGAFTERMAGEALRMLREADSLTLRLSPTDVATITNKHPELGGVNGVVHITEDPTLKLGGVIAECRFGRIDASIEGRLAAIAHKLRNEVAEVPEVEAQAASEPVASVVKDPP